ncbi:unnamed protein product [Rotaria sordida]|uniref:Mutator-like transposase domain-containing protein n=1 Tax=Rotaria sordida TaxID=392033 RepID=A0A819YAB1_9BILA|nr:unnamed protein product [Rotaria sordida]CAF1103915.1 unnamed protein product [Rotaria sordida]CAF1144322.1 unnamed protein product [Rotaria sordida]CAF4006499.1 unnamed protein product [Rotaria sordida]CAF4156421.1 unnamed protein product [Rotaria sordida]
MRRIRSKSVEPKTVDSSSASSDEDSVMSVQNQFTSSTDNADDMMNFYLIIHMQSLILLLKQTLCSECNNYWNGSASIKQRDGLYMHIEFMCSNCRFITHLHSSPQIPNTRRREINIRLEIGGILCGLSHGGVMKFLGALNLPPPVQEQRYSEAQQFIWNYVTKAQEESMTAAVEEAIVEGGGMRELTVSGDGAWPTRGYSSVHGIAALCSTTSHPKVLDVTWSSKKCSKCQGAESLRYANPDLFLIFQENHDCQLNYAGSSGGMEKEMIHEMFCRSLPKYNIKYTSYIGDGDAKVHKYLVDNPSYSDVNIKKIEDTNHFAKRMLTRIMKIKKENANKILSDGKRFSGKGRMTDAQAVKFKIYFAKAIRENKTDLNKLYQRSWAIFKHHYSTDEQPMHEWCDLRWCKYLQATANGEKFNHHSQKIFCFKKKKRVKTSQAAAATTTSISSSESDNENFHTVNEENFDDISHDLTIFEQMESDQDEYDDNNDYEPGGDD